MNNNSGEEIIDLLEVFKNIWQSKLQIIGISLFFGLCTYVYTLNVPDEYTTKVLLSSSHQENSASLSSASGLGSLASIAGLSIGGSAGSESDIALEVMQSWDFVDQFISTYNYQVPIVAATSWDRTTGQLDIDQSIYDTKQKKWVRETNRPDGAEPSSWELFSVFKDRLTVNKMKGTGFILIEFEFFSPVLGKELMDNYVSFINQVMRERKLDQVSRNIRYLEAEIEKTNVAKMKEIFYQLIEEQTKSLMLAQATPEYVFVTVNPAMVEEAKSAPKRFLMVLVGLIWGGLVGIIWALFTRVKKYKTHG